MEKLIDNAHKFRTSDNTKYLPLDVFYKEELYPIAEGVTNYIIKVSYTEVIKFAQNPI